MYAMYTHEPTPCQKIIPDHKVGIHTLHGILLHMVLYGTYSLAHIPAAGSCVPRLLMH